MPLPALHLAIAGNTCTLTELTDARRAKIRPPRIRPGGAPFHEGNVTVRFDPGSSSLVGELDGRLWSRAVPTAPFTPCAIP